VNGGAPGARSAEADFGGHEAQPAAKWVWRAGAGARAAAGWILR
jgi:hypothetical protein